MDSECLNLIQKLAKIRAISDVAQKNKKGFNYTYTDLADILASVTAGMKKYRVSLIPTIVPGTGRVSQNVIVNTKVDKTGKTYDQTSTEMLFCADMVFRWVNEDDITDCIDVPWFVAGSQSDPSQAIGSGLTYTERQFLTNYFQIASPEYDVDAYRSKQRAAEESESKAIAAEIINEFDSIVKRFLTENPDKVEEIKKFIGRYAKNANYLAIKDPSLAAKLIEEFKENYIKEEK